MIERTLDIKTPGGMMTTFIVHPERGPPRPPILFFMDAPGIREELRDMARRIAAVGYYVMLPNLYYRSGEMELGPIPRDDNAPARLKMYALMESINIDLVMEDAAALIAFADGDGAAAKGPIGAIGYCMSGQYAINAAARWPERVRCAASLYGVRLITDRADSPHTVAARAKAELYFACAETDRWMPLEEIPKLKAALEAARVKAEVEIYPGTEHGFAFPARPVYVKAAAERHWERLFALFQRNLA